MQPIGIIVGHGYAKAVSNRGAISFPAVAAQASAADYDTALGGGRAAVSLNGQGDWIVGDDALIFAPGRQVSILDRARYRHPSFVALARAALLQVASDSGPLRILSGMPSAWFRDTAAKEALKGALLKAASPWGEALVTLAPEVAGVFYAYAFEGGRLDTARIAGDIGVVDFGYRDGNVGLFSNGRYVAGESVPGGAFEALKEIKRLIADRYRLELSLHQVDAAVIAGGLLVDGVTAPLPEGTAAALSRGLDPVLAAGRSLWPNGGRGLRALVVGGGGAHALAEAIAREFPNQFYGVDEPQMAGPRGFRAMAAAAELAAREA